MNHDKVGINAKRAREDDSSTAAAKALHISHLKKQHDDLFIEITKGLDYVQDDGAHAALLANSSFAFLGLDRSMDRSSLKFVLEEVFLKSGAQLAREHVGEEHDPSLPTAFFVKWHIAFQLRTALLNASLCPVDIDNVSPSSLEYYPGLPNLETLERLSPVVLREEDRRFWENCIEVSKERKVCGIGIPGIGKTTTTFYLIKTLVFREMQTVVYVIQQINPKDTVYTKIVPVVEDGAVVDVEVTCAKGESGPLSVHSWSDGNYYVVDPGNTKFSCDPSPPFLHNVRVIIVSSCDNRHWGDREFSKMRSRAGKAAPPPSPDEDVHAILARAHLHDDSPTLGGTFVYGRSWALTEIIACKRLFRKLLDATTDEAICSRYRVTGGSLRMMLDYPYSEFENRVQRAVTRLSDRTINELADGVYAKAFNPECPESCLVSVEPVEDMPSQYHLTISSDFAEEKIAEKRMQVSWYAVLDEDNSGNRGNLFEAFIRNKLAGPVESLTMERQSSPDAPTTGKDKRKNYVASDKTFSLPGRRSLCRVTNLAESVKKGTVDTLFYSKDEFERLIDMICRIDEGYLAVQVTIRKQHDAGVDKIDRLVNDLALGPGKKLFLVYCLPQNRLADFETSPVNPLFGRPDLAEKVEIYHVAIDG